MCVAAYSNGIKMWIFKSIHPKFTPKSILQLKSKGEREKEKSPKTLDL